MQGAGDFFKPFHSFSKMELLENALRAAGYPAEKADTVMEKLSEDAFWGSSDANVFLHRDEPVFDGPVVQRLLLCAYNRGIGTFFVHAAD